MNTTEPYAGTHILDWRNGECMARFEVTATGEWAITMYVLAPGVEAVAERHLTVPGTYAGVGDDVILLNTADAKPDLANVTGNAGGHHFAIVGWSAGGRDLLVNTTDVYEGTVILDADTLALEVTAAGEWSIEVTAR